MENKSVNDFTKGLFSRVSADKIPDNAFSECANIDLTENFLPKSIKGKLKVNSSAISNSSCMGMTIYNNKELGSFMVVACGGYLWYSQLGSDNFQKYQIDNDGTMEDVQIDSSVRVRFAQYNDRLFVFTGKYPVIENSDFNDACILVLYKTTATYINRDTFYAWNANSVVYYTLSATPASGDLIFTDLYRSKLVATVASYDSTNNTFTDTSSVTYTRTSGSDKVDGNVPQGLKIGFIHQERLFGLGSIEDDNGIYWSQPYDPATWTPVYGLNYDTCGKDDGEIITGGASYGGVYVYIFKKHNVYRYLTSGDIDSWGSVKVDTTYGALAHETIRLFNGLLTYLSADGVAQLNGNTAVLIDEAIKDKTTNIDVGSEYTINRNYTKNNNWDSSGATTKGIVVSNNKIKTIQNFTKSSFADDKETGVYVSATNSGINFNADMDYSGNSYQTTSVHGGGNGSYICCIHRPSPDILIDYIDFYVGNFDMDSLGMIVNFGSLNSSGNPRIDVLKYWFFNTSVTTSQTLIANSWNRLTFDTPIHPQGNKDYYLDFSVSGGTSKYVNIRTFAGDKPAYIGNSATNQNLWCKFEACYDSSDQCYISKEIDLNVSSVNLQKIVSAYTEASGTAGKDFTVYVANYPVSCVSWESVSSSYITQYSIVSGSDINVNKSNAYRYLRYKIVPTQARQDVLTSLAFTIADSYSYESEAIQIATSSPTSWGNAEIVKTGSTDVANKATIYMRTGSSTAELSNATYYEIQNNTQIPAAIAKKILVQFKVMFPANSDNEVSSIKINFSVKTSLTKICACVWKTKYRLNVPVTSGTDVNSVEYIYDKDGYWTIKDNENNFDYASSLDNLFACSGADGFVYKKDVGYDNNGTSYNCYFVTKKFVLSDFENLFRSFKVRYVSSGVDMVVGVSVDDGDYVSYSVSANDNLVEVIKSLVGIVKGQSIKFRFSWVSNSSTQVHNICYYWQVLRHLNIER